MSTPDGVTLDFDDAYALFMGDEEYVSFFNSFLRNISLMTGMIFG